MLVIRANREDPDQTASLNQSWVCAVLSRAYSSLQNLKHLPYLTHSIYTIFTI